MVARKSASSRNSLLTQTALEQISVNREFRELAELSVDADLFQSRLRLPQGILVIGLIGTAQDFDSLATHLFGREDGRSVLGLPESDFVLPEIRLVDRAEDHRHSDLGVFRCREISQPGNASPQPDRRLKAV